jgi:hypothetical protein
LQDVFSGRPWQVEVEMEMALGSQRLDILILSMDAAGPSESVLQLPVFIRPA